jgi:hypothetical protein
MVINQLSMKNLKISIQHVVPSLDKKNDQKNPFIARSYNLLTLLLRSLSFKKVEGGTIKWETGLKRPYSWVF